MNDNLLDLNAKAVKAYCAFRNSHFAYGAPEKRKLEEEYHEAREALWAAAVPIYTDIFAYPIKKGYEYVGSLENQEKVTIRRSPTKYSYAVVHSVPQNTKFEEYDPRAYVTFHAAPVKRTRGKDEIRQTFKIDLMR